VGERTIAHHLRASGYQVGYVGKWHLASSPREGIDYMIRPIPPERRGGYEDFWLASDVLEFTSHAYDGHMYDEEGRKVEFPADRYRVDCVTDFALDILRRRDHGKPIFLFVSYIEPHQQNDHGHFEGPRGSKERFARYRLPGDLENSGGDWEQELPDYLGQVNSLDAAVGRIRSEIEEQGIGGNTLLIYTSDHGCHFRTRNSEYKRSCHDGSIRIPMVVSGPGFGGGRVVRELVSLIDLPPTLLEVSGREPPTYMRGHSLLPLLEEDVPSLRDDVFVQISESQVGRALRADRWKYSVQAPTANGTLDRESGIYEEAFLYDLEADPHERENLVREPEYREVRDELRGRLLSRLVGAGESPPTIIPRA
jgi:uncharacterized sulfatase